MVVQLLVLRQRTDAGISLDDRETASRQDLSGLPGDNI